MSFHLPYNLELNKQAFRIGDLSSEQKNPNDFQNAMSDYFMFEKYIVGPNMCIFTIHEIFAAM